jgi:hypothetical protein
MMQDLQFKIKRNTLRDLTPFELNQIAGGCRSVTTTVTVITITDKLTTIGGTTTCGTGNQK